MPASHLHPQVNSLEPSFTLCGVGVCFRVINISSLNYLHIYYKAKKGLKGNSAHEDSVFWGATHARQAGVTDAFLSLL